jgi:hypothetical protein
MQGRSWKAQEWQPPTDQQSQGDFDAGHPDMTHGMNTAVKDPHLYTIDRLFRQRDNEQNDKPYPGLA